MAGELIIDLGDEFGPVADAERARRRERRSRRSLAMAAVALLALLALAGSVRPPGPPAPRIATITANAGGTLMVVGSSLIVADVRDGHNTMSAYRLSDGVRRWTSRLSVLVSSLDMRLIGHVVVAGFHGSSVSGDKTEGIDARTGAVLWTSGSELVQTYPASGAVLLSDTSHDTMIDAGTGAVRWSQNVTPNCRVNLSDHLVTLCPRSTLRVIDLTTGAIIASRSLPAPTLDPSPLMYDDSVKLAELDGVVVVGHLGTGAGPVLDAYRAADLTPIWSVPFYDSALILPCRGILCLSDGRISSGLDPQTGRSLPFPGFDPPADEESYAGPGPASADSELAIIPGGAPRYTYAGGIDGFGVQTGYSNASAVATFAASMPFGVPGATHVDSWIATIRVRSKPRGEIAITPAQRLAGVGVQSCVLVDPYLLCAINGSQMDIYDVSRLTRDAAG